MKKLVAILLALSIFCACVACGKKPDANDSSSVPSSTVSEPSSDVAIDETGGGVLYLKVNPEIAIHFNAHGEVTKVIAHNDDAKAIVDQYLNYKGKPCKTVVGELVVEIGKAGYFVEDVEHSQNQITIEIEGDFELPEETFLEDVEQEVRDCVDKHKWDCPIKVEDKRPSAGSDQKEEQKDKDKDKDKNDKKEESKKPNSSVPSVPENNTSSAVESKPESTPVSSAPVSSTPSKPAESKPESTPTTSVPSGSTPSSAPSSTPSNTPSSTPSVPIHTHNYSGATCTAPAKCSCGATLGDALGHDYSLSDGKCIRCQTKDPGFKELTEGVWMYMKKDENNYYRNGTLDFQNGWEYSKLMLEWSDMAEEDRNIYLTQFPKAIKEFQGGKYVCGAGEDMQFTYKVTEKIIEISRYWMDGTTKNPAGNMKLERRSNTELVCIDENSNKGKVYTWYAEYPFYIENTAPKNKVLSDDYWILVQDLPDTDIKNLFAFNFKKEKMYAAGACRFSLYDKEMQESIGEDSDFVDTWNGEKWHTGSGEGYHMVYAENGETVTVTIIFGKGETYEENIAYLTFQRTGEKEYTLTNVEGTSDYVFANIPINSKLLWSETYPFSKLISSFLDS